MKTRFIGGLLCVGLSVSLISAQEDISSVAAGSKALLFSFNGLSTLGAGAYNGGIGGKYFLSDPLAVRGGVKFSTIHQSMPSTSDTGTDGSISAMQIGLFGGGEYHLSMNRLSPYIGAEAGFTMTSTKSVLPINPPSTTKTTVKNSEKGELNHFAGTSIDLGGLAGAEFFLTKEISLSAEYLIGFSMLNRPDEKIISVTGSTEIKTTKKLGSVWNLGISNGGSLTLAVYF